MNGNAWHHGMNTPPQSSIIIHAGSLASNHRYQFQVWMVNRRNETTQATGYLLVKVEEIRSPMISIA